MATNMTNPSREEQLEAIRGKSLTDHIKEIEKEFEERFVKTDKHGDKPIPPELAKRFLTSKLREIATATLAACRVEEREIPLQQYDIPADWDEVIYTEVATNWRIAGENMAISEQKKKAEEYLKP